MDRGAAQAAVYGVTKSWTRLSDFTFTFHFHALEKKMATHSSILALRIPGTGEPGGLSSMGSHRVAHDWSDLAAAAAGLPVQCWKEVRWDSVTLLLKSGRLFFCRLSYIHRNFELGFNFTVNAHKFNSHYFYRQCVFEVSTLKNRKAHLSHHNLI